MIIYTGTTTRGVSLQNDGMYALYRTIHIPIIIYFNN